MAQPAVSGSWRHSPFSAALFWALIAGDRLAAQLAGAQTH